MLLLCDDDKAVAGETEDRGTRVIGSKLTHLKWGHHNQILLGHDARYFSAAERRSSESGDEESRWIFIVCGEGGGGAFGVWIRREGLWLASNSYYGWCARLHWPGRSSGRRAWEYADQSDWIEGHRYSWSARIPCSWSLVDARLGGFFGNFDSGSRWDGWGRIKDNDEGDQALRDHFLNDYLVVGCNQVSVGQLVTRSVWPTVQGTTPYSATLAYTLSVGLAFYRLYASMLRCKL